MTERARSARELAPILAVTRRLAGGSRGMKARNLEIQRQFGRRPGFACVPGEVHTRDGQAAIAGHALGFGSVAKGVGIREVPLQSQNAAHEPVGRQQDRLAAKPRRRRRQHESRPVLAEVEDMARGRQRCGHFAHLGAELRRGHRSAFDPRKDRRRRVARDQGRVHFDIQWRATMASCRASDACA